MSEPFLSQIGIFGFNFAPRGWAQCDGQILPINQNQSLYSLLGTTYGGDGRTSFGLPDLRGRVPIHFDGSHALGQRSGQETVVLGAAQTPAHSHNLTVSTDDAASNDPLNNVFAKANFDVYHEATNLVPLIGGSTGNVGGSQAHNNMQPYLAINFCIALVGIFPSRN